MKVIAQLNIKGGVGKTTMTAEMAMYSHLVKGYKTIVIDSDINGSMLDFACDRMEICNLYFPEVIGHCQSNIDKKIKMLKESGKYDICIVDCHGDWKMLETNLTYVSDLVLMPVIPDVKNIRPSIKCWDERIKEIVEDRGGKPEVLMYINKIKKRHSNEERRLIKLIKQSGVNLCEKMIFTHDKCFRDTWRDGLTILDVYLNELDKGYIDAGINLRKYMEEIFEVIDKLEE